MDENHYPCLHCNQSNRICLRVYHFYRRKSQRVRISGVKGSTIYGRESTHSLATCRPITLWYHPLIILTTALIRDISKLSGTALVADFFILLGLVVLYYFDIFTLSTKGLSDIQLFNSRDYVLFLGTAAFAFEGIGLIIPIQESMIRPEKFKFVLTGVMIILILVFTSIGTLSYAAYGSSVKTVIISSLPQDSGNPSFVQPSKCSLRERCPISILASHFIVYTAPVIPRDPNLGAWHRASLTKWKTKPLR